MIFISGKVSSINNLESNNDPNKPKYDKVKWKKIMDTTQINYANMIKRLTRKSKFSNFILIYYSIFLIITTLTCKYFSNHYNIILSEYFSIILSIVVLAYSLINNNANYSVRIHNLENSLNELKNLKRKLDQGDLDKCINEYNEITDKTERRDDIDFFNTVRSLAKLHKVNIFTKKIKKGNKDINQEKVDVVLGYLSEISVFIQSMKIASEYLWYIIVICIPVVMFIICIMAARIVL